MGTAIEADMEVEAIQTLAGCLVAGTKVAGACKMRDQSTTRTLYGQHRGTPSVAQGAGHSTELKIVGSHTTTTSAPARQRGEKFTVL